MRQMMFFLCLLLVFLAVPTGLLANAECLPALENEAVFNIDNQTVTVDGSDYLIDVQPFIKDERTFLPVRFLGETLGAEVEWINNEAVLKLPEQSITLKPGTFFINNNGSYELMNTVPYIISPGRLCLPARYVCEAAGYRVDWNPEKRSMTITK